jgi:hypothetical protein
MRGLAAALLIAGTLAVTISRPANSKPEWSAQTKLDFAHFCAARLGSYVYPEDWLLGDDTQGFVERNHGAAEGVDGSPMLLP